MIESSDNDALAQTSLNFFLIMDGRCDVVFVWM